MLCNFSTFAFLAAFHFIAAPVLLALQKEPITVRWFVPILYLKEPRKVQSLT